MRTRKTRRRRLPTHENRGSYRSERLVRPGRRLARQSLVTMTMSLEGSSSEVLHFRHARGPWGSDRQPCLEGANVTR